MVEGASAPLPTGAYITGVLLFVMFGFLIWLIASYPNDLAERPHADDCEAIARPNHRADNEKPDTLGSSAGIKNAKNCTTIYAGNDAEGKMTIDRQLLNIIVNLPFIQKISPFYYGWFMSPPDWSSSAFCKGIFCSVASA
jgi:hypothetical protein